MVFDMRLRYVGIRWFVLNATHNLLSKPEFVKARRLLRRLGEGSEEVCNDLLEGSVRLGGDLTVLGDGSQQTLVAGLDVLGELLLEASDLAGVKFVEVTTDTTVDDGDLSEKNTQVSQFVNVEVLLQIILKVLAAY